MSHSALVLLLFLRPPLRMSELLPTVRIFMLMIFVGPLLLAAVLFASRITEAVTTIPTMRLRSVPWTVVFAFHPLQTLELLVSESHPVAFHGPKYTFGLIKSQWKLSGKLRDPCTQLFSPWRQFFLILLLHYLTGSTKAVLTILNFFYL